MRLINAMTVELEEFISDPPPYAILSHTWGVEEVTFQDMASESRLSMQGYAKIHKTCETALKQHLTYAWVDTCCIDKSSSAELTESINSMFQWYKDASVCYALLEDLEPNSEDFARCKWFSRGWTLQELLAPTQLEFYDASWTCRGTRQDMVKLLSDATRIPQNVLEGHRSLADCSVARKMSWAARRETTRIEDIAYCLLGIFDVHMPPIYGEGVNAFRRLQEEIIKRKNDLTIFAWKPPEIDQELTSQGLGLLAESPSVFQDSSCIEPFFNNFSTRFSVTNMGLWVSGDASIRLVSVRSRVPHGRHVSYALFLGKDDNTLDQIAIFLRKGGPRLFFRDGRFPLIGNISSDIQQLQELEVPDYHVLIDPVANPSDLFHPYRNLAIHVPYINNFSLQNAVPLDLWDQVDRVFLKPKPYSRSRYGAVLAMSFEASIARSRLYLIVLSTYNEISDQQECVIVPENRIGGYVSTVFHPRHRRESVDPSDLIEHCPDFTSWQDTIQIFIDGNKYNISVSLVTAQPGDTVPSPNLMKLVFRVKSYSADRFPMIHTVDRQL